MIAHIFHIFLFLITFPAVANAQTVEWKLKRYTAAAPAYLIAGAADGMNQTLNYHYSAFKKRHPAANDQYWHPGTSWTNKYEKGILGQTSMVWTTDAQHLTRTLNRTAIRFNTIALPIAQAKQKWWWYIIDFTYLFTVESIGFHSTYSLYYKSP